MTQLSKDESNSFVKYCGGGALVGVSVGVGTRVDVAGIGVGEAGTVTVGGRVGPGVGVACWHAEVRMRNPMRRNFFMALLIT
jgi:hypothetical protein